MVVEEFEIMVVDCVSGNTPIGLVAPISTEVFCCSIDGWCREVITSEPSGNVSVCSRLHVIREGSCSAKEALIILS
jgi:hypothetical protein